jgi:hypothetical protein
MLKKPKKYEPDNVKDSATKKRVKSPSKIEFDDMLLYNENQDPNNLQAEDLNQVMLCFTLRERVLLVQTEG